MHWCRGASASPLLANFEFALWRAFERFVSPLVADTIKKTRWPYGQWWLLTASQVDGIANHPLQCNGRWIIQSLQSGVQFLCDRVHHANLHHNAGGHKLNRPGAVLHF